jgi:hypothetical protein
LHTEPRASPGQHERAEELAAQCCWKKKIKAPWGINREQKSELWAHYVMENRSYHRNHEADQATRKSKKGRITQSERQKKSAAQNTSKRRQARATPLEVTFDALDLETKNRWEKDLADSLDWRQHRTETPANEVGEENQISCGTEKTVEKQTGR